MYRWILAAGLVFAMTSAAAADMAAAGRAVLEQRKTAVVTVKLVIETKFSSPMMGSQEDEAKSEVTGTMIGPDGLTVISLTGTDPTSMLANMGGMFGDMDFESKATDIKIMLEDGTELDAEEVLRDNDLDLSFVRPLEAPGEALPYVDLAASSSAELLDEVIVVNRLGRVAQRVYSVSLERIEAIVERPRMFYIPGTQQTRAGLGAPAFDAKGQIVGVLLMRSINVGDAGMGGMMSMMSGGAEGVTPIILPAQDVADAAAQAPPRGESEDEGASEPEE